MTEYHIAVWDCTFCLIDDDGNTKLDDEGEVQIYGAPKMDWSYLTEYLELKDLEGY